LFFTCFSSSIYRIRIALDLARKHGRKVAVVGRSMMESTEIAQDWATLMSQRPDYSSGQMRDFPRNR